MTVQLSQPPRPKAAKLVHQVSWEQLEEIDRSLEDFGGIKLVYLDGILELMPISEEHEDATATLRVLLEAYLRAKGIRFYSRGGPTLGRRELGARSEPDESYNLGTRKPYPDLVVAVLKLQQLIHQHHHPSRTFGQSWRGGLLNLGFE